MEVTNRKLSKSESIISWVALSWLGISLLGALGLGVWQLVKLLTR